MSYKQAYNFLLGINKLARKEYLHDPKHCEIYLKRLEYFLMLLGNPQKNIPHYIHITGTSGKGSTAIMIASILQASGKKVALLTSPHPSTITERWEINGKAINQSEFAKIITTKIKPAWKKYLEISPYDPISFYEMMTAIGLYYFASKKVDYAVIEVGCGGRYDSTNVIPNKDIAVITNIGLDHVNVLGNTKAKIAYEKAGIIKRGCKTITGEDNKKILKIIKNECDKNKSPLKISNYKFLITNKNLNELIFKYKNEIYKLPILGTHQIQNAILAIDTATILGIKNNVIKKGLIKIKLPLRCEIVNKKPLIILDGAHNPDKIKTTIKTVNDLKSAIYNPKNKHLLLAFAADKSIEPMLKQLVTLKPITVACTIFTNNKFRTAASPQELTIKLKKLLPKATVNSFDNPQKAWHWSLKQAEKDDVLLVTGSFFLAGQIMSLIDKDGFSL